MNIVRRKIAIVGGTPAAAFAALKAAELGAEVVFITNAPLRRSALNAYPYGFAVPAGTKGDGDNSETHAADTFEHGKRLADKSAIDGMCGAALKISELMQRLGVVFERNHEGIIELWPSEGSSKKRVAHGFGALTQQLISCLDAQMRRLAVEGKLVLREGMEFLSLVIDDGGACRGVTAIDVKNLKISALPSDAVIMCASGYEGLYGRLSANPGATGFALASCIEQGAVPANLGFMQFYPFSVRMADSSRLINEAVIFSGAKIDDSGALDLRGVDGDVLCELIPDLNFFEAAGAFDSKEMRLNVAPAAAASLGGLKVDIAHKTNVNGLFAAGECAAQYHGACALSGNELLAMAHGGFVAAKSSFEYASGTEKPGDSVTPTMLESSQVREEKLNAKIASQEGSENAHALMSELCTAMCNGAFAARTKEGVGSALSKIDEIKNRFSKASLLDRCEWGNAEIIFMRKAAKSFALAEAVLKGEK